MAVNLQGGKYKIYHILGKKIGCTTNVQKRVVEEQGFKTGEYEILYETDDIKKASKVELTLQKDLGYKVDIKPYYKLFEKKMKQDINVTDQTTTFPIAVEEINGAFLSELSWNSPYGVVNMDSLDKIEWVIDNAKKSMYNSNRCYVYNKALYEASPFERASCRKKPLKMIEQIRKWASDRDIIVMGDAKTQYIKLQEEAGELAQALLKDDQAEVIDAIGDIVVVLTNLASMRGVHIETCISSAYDVITKREGKMINGTFVKNER